MDKMRKHDRRIPKVIPITYNNKRKYKNNKQNDADTIRYSLHYAGERKQKAVHVAWLMGCVFLHFLLTFTYNNSVNIQYRTYTYI